LIQEALQHHRAGRLAEAEAGYRQALSLAPSNADCLHLLGMVAFQSGRNEEAAELIGSAIALHPAAASYHANLANVLQACGRLEEAEASCRRALALRPQLPEVHLNLGHILKALGHVDAALASYRQALALRPELAEARAAEATALLLTGDFAAGWPGFEARWQTRDYDTAPRDYPQPLWRGEPLDGRLLIWGEQGIGDEIMFAGLVPELAAAGLRCVLDCAPRLQPLFARSFPGVAVTAGYDPARNTNLDIAAHLPSGSLPGLLRTSAAAFAQTRSPYLLADPEQRQRFRTKYEDGRLLVGIAWFTKNSKSGRSRSIGLAQLAPLFALPGIQWISLQYGGHDTLEAEAADALLTIDREVDQFTDLDSFAAQVAAMDLVLTIDNSTAHLAAALGVPTWLLLPYAPDWRWGLTSETSPWYPPMRLFRQSRIGSWEAVLSRVQCELMQICSDR
jgi:ADP-heptose:LPS heptosyltransferase